MRLRRSVVVLVAALVAGCGSALPAPRAGSTLPTASPSPLAVSVSPDVACPPQQAVHLPADQATVTDAFVCGDEVRTVPGEGQWWFHVVRRVSGGLEPLLAAYSRPDDHTPLAGGSECTTDLPNPLVVYLHSAQPARAVRAPQDQCGHPTSRARSAYDALTKKVVWEGRGKQAQSQASIDSGCSDAYKDTLAEDERYGGSRGQAGRPAPLVAPVMVCTYRVVPDAQGDRVGHLDGHARLTTRQLEAVNAALGHVRIDVTCSRHEQTRFALLTDAGGASTVVALDGCAVSQDGGWWHAGDDLRAALT